MRPTPSTHGLHHGGPSHPAEGVIARVHPFPGEATRIANRVGMFVSNVDGVRLSAVDPAGFSPRAPTAPTGDGQNPANSFGAAA